ncbi:choice-of-anchor D domain-containing protein [Herbiconiux daphne]|uniref:Choice-of-anchor D domain-containing protein n=1 Tax=Herbiconiux daphne TaxID=2970914 RepID=A0ABT2H5Z5_9MICO|nr:choice-of-anchor D domain-containing protein [Herbiconiux daphne]MCS5735343.1 choice-of-anchor D domain-containing protein [Herbiconiux daphne]
MNQKPTFPSRPDDGRGVRARVDRLLSVLVTVLGVAAVSVGAVGLSAVAAGPAAAVSAPVAVPLVSVPLAAPVAVPLSVVRAPGDATSVSMPGRTPDFGWVKTGKTVSRTIDLLNDGTDGIIIDPGPLNALTTPFALVATTIVAGDEIEPGETRSVSVTYTAGAIGTTPLQKITLVLQDADAPGETTFDLDFRGESRATERGAFDLTTTTGATTADFGSVAVGQSVTKSFRVTVRGIDPLRFEPATIEVRTSAGMPIGTITVTASSFGTGVTLNPGDTGTFDLTFRPTAAGSFPGTLSVLARTVGDPEAPSVTMTMPVVAAAVVPTPTPTPTPSPTGTATPAPTGAPTSTPRPGGSGTGSGTGSGSGVAGSGGSSVIGRGGQSLAQTGAEQASGVAGGALGVLLCGAAIVLSVRGSKRKGEAR